MEIKEEERFTLELGDIKVVLSNFGATIV
jgi:aldose 1-epimerase